MATTAIDSELSETDAASIARQVLVDAWNTGDVALLDALLCDGYVRHGRTDEVRSGTHQAHDQHRSCGISRPAYLRGTPGRRR